MFCKPNLFLFSFFHVYENLQKWANLCVFKVQTALSRYTALLQLKNLILVQGYLGSGDQTL